jgi:ribosome-binding protein aMBF1 (putative translation factor)
MAQERTTNLGQDQSSNQSQELIMQRISESLNWLRRTPTPTSAPPQQSERNVRDAIRQLSRQRVSDLLRQLRAAHGLSYEQVHDRTGLSQQLLFDVEFKERRLALDELRRLAACYQVTVDDLLGIDIDV